MKQSLTYKISAIFLSVLVLFSSLSFSIEKHFCEGETSISFFNDAQDLCEMQSHECHIADSQSSPCHSNIEKTNCCIDTSEFIQGITIEQQAQATQRLGFQPVIFLTSIFFSTNLVYIENVTTAFFLKYSLLKSIDIGLIFQVFRI